MQLRSMLESKTEAANTTCVVYHLNSGAEQWHCLSQQIPNQIITNQGENKNRNHINTGVSFNYIHYMANLSGRSGAKW